MDRQISYQTRSSLHSMISCASRWRIVSRADRTSSESDAAQAAATSPCSVPVQARTSPSDVASTAPQNPGHSAMRANACSITVNGSFGSVLMEEYFKTGTRRGTKPWGV